MVLQHDLGDRLIYSVRYTTDGITVNESGLTIYVRNRGKNNEEAYVLGFNPLYVTVRKVDPTLFNIVNDVLTYIESEYGYVKCLDTGAVWSQGFASITCYKPSDTGLTEERRYVVIKDTTVEIY